MKDSWEDDFNDMYVYIRERISDTNSYYRHFYVNALQIYFSFSERYVFNFLMSFRLVIKRIIDNVLGYLSLFLLSLKSDKWDILVVLTEPNHIDQFKAFDNSLSKKLRILIVTDKLAYVRRFYSQYGMVLFVPDGLFETSKSNDLKSFCADMESRFSKQWKQREMAIIRILDFCYNKVELANRALHKIVKKNKIRAVLNFNDHTLLGRVLVDGANRLKIPTFYGMHGMLSDEYIEGIHISDYYFVYGEATRGIFMRRGIRPIQIEVTGAPYLDQLLVIKSNLTTTIKSSLMIPDKVKVILVALSGPGHTTSVKNHEAILKSIEQLISLNDMSMLFVFKLHKKDSLKYYERLKSMNARNVRIVTYSGFNGMDTIFDWISLADLVITGASTTAIEAMIFSKPILTIDLLNEYSDETLFIREGATYHVKEISQLQSQFERAIDNLDSSIIAKAHEFVAYNYFKLDGQSGSRFVAQLLNKIS